jgi:ATP-dependent RNA helicase SUPV3L1/SUV3
MEKLIEFYVDQYRKVCGKATKNVRMQKYEHKVNSRINELKNTHGSPEKEELAAGLHQNVKKLVQATYFYNNKAVIRKVNTVLIPELVRLDLEMLSPEERDRLDEETLKILAKEAFGEICEHSLAMVYHSYLNQTLQKQILSLVPAKPEMEFAESIAMERHFILHVGPTNSGKTYHALERLKDASNGVYLGPLRLLALEVYERMREYGTPCTMRTGQECIEDPESRVTSSTVEMLDLDQIYDVAVIDEAQMVSDELRGHSWTRAILGVKAREIHVCMSPAAEEVLVHLIELGKGTYEIHRYERKTKLELEEEPFNFPEDVREGDALIVFSKKAVLNVAGRLESTGIESSVIYGSLPPEIRRRQMELFNKKETKVVVSTDAIGMGLNLPVRRIVFMQMEKFDGKTTRALDIPEIRQIAGRAGRFGLYETGYVTAMDETKLNYLKRQWKKEELPITRVSLGFPQVLLSMDAPLDVILTLWHDVRPSEPFEKINIDDMLFLYREAYRMRMFIPDFDDKHVLYRMITCPIDIKDAEVVRLWGEYCMNYTADISLEKPRRYSHYQGLVKLESYYKKLDLYYQLSMRLGKLIDMQWLEDEREKTQDEIMQMLLVDKHEYILRCKYCGRILPVDSPYRMCEGCRREAESRFPVRTHGGGKSRKNAGRKKNSNGSSGNGNAAGGNGNAAGSGNAGSAQKRRRRRRRHKKKEVKL